MKKRMCMAILAMVFLFVIPSGGVAASVHEIPLGFITGTDGIVLDFTADVAPYNYVASLTELIGAPFEFENLTLVIKTPENLFIEDATGTSIDVAFDLAAGQNFSAMIFGVGSGPVNTGIYDFSLNAVPVPATLMLFGSGLFAIFTLRRKK